MSLPSRFMFRQASRFINDYAGGCPICRIGCPNVALNSGFWFFFVGLSCSCVCGSLLKDVGYENQVPPLLISTHDPSVFCFLFIVRCPPSGLCLLWRLDSRMDWTGQDWMSVFITNPSWNTEHGSSSTGYLSSYGLRFIVTFRNNLCRVCL